MFVADDLLQAVRQQAYLHYDQSASAQSAYLFRAPASAPLADALAHALALSAARPAALRALGLIDPQDDPLGTVEPLDTLAPPTDAELRTLLRSALADLPLVGFGLALDHWRWDVFAGAGTPGPGFPGDSGWNQAFWRARQRYQGVAPPLPRVARRLLDAAAKYHVPAGLPYLRHVMARILAFQVRPALCP